MLDKRNDDIGTLNLKYTMAILIAKQSNIPHEVTKEK